MIANEIVVAGHPVNSPVEIVVEYASQFGGTLARYDFGDRGEPDVLTAEEIWRTRIIRSRISRSERDELEQVAAACRPLWSRITFKANLRDAEPTAAGGLWADMLKLYARFTEVPGISMAKASKILHLKRPNLYPVLDSRLAGLYRGRASDAARKYPELGFKRIYWAAVRDDLILNERPLRTLRAELDAVQSPYKLSELTDLRILDILSWSR